MTMKDSISAAGGEVIIPDVDSKDKEFDVSSIKVERLEDQAIGDNVEYVDAATEQAITRKLDYRIIPMIMWVYLMNMMDRGKLYTPIVARGVRSSFWNYG